MVGRPREITDAELLRLILAAEGGSLTTTEVRNRIGYTRVGTWKRLKKLSELGHLSERKDTHGGPTLWTITVAGREFLQVGQGD